MKDQEEVTLVVDKETKMPLCVLLQAMFGGQSSSFLPTELWQLTPPKEPAMVTGTVQQWNDWAKAQLEIRRLTDQDTH